VEIRQKAVEAALAVVSGAYQTSLLSYFTHRDLFPALMKVWWSVVLFTHKRLMVAVHTRRGRHFSRLRIIYTPRSALKLQQIRITKSLSTAARGFCQWRHDTKDHTCSRTWECRASRCICWDTGRSSWRMDLEQYFEHDRIGKDCSGCEACYACNRPRSCQRDVCKAVCWIQYYKNIRWQDTVQVMQPPYI